MTTKQAIEYGKQWDAAIASRGDTPMSDARQFLSIALAAIAYMDEHERQVKIAKQVFKEYNK